MRKWLWLVAPLLVVALASLAVACGDGEEGATGTPAAEETAAQETSTAEAGGLVANIEPFGAGSTASGTATLTASGGGTEVAVEMDGLPEGAHANHIHIGSCDAQGDIDEGLTELQAGAGGSASATTSIPDRPLDDFAEGHYVAVHAGGGEVIGCGDLVAD